MDHNYFKCAAQICGNAIDLIIDLWPAREAASEELVKTLQGLQALQTFFVSSTFEDGAEAAALESRTEAALKN